MLQLTANNAKKTGNLKYESGCESAMIVGTYADCEYENESIPSTKPKFSE